MTMHVVPSSSPPFQRIGFGEVSADRIVGSRSPDIAGAHGNYSASLLFRGIDPVFAPTGSEQEPNPWGIWAYFFTSYVGVVLRCAGGGGGGRGTG